MKLWKKILLIVLVLLALYLAVFCIWPWVAFTAAEDAAVSIIGGADGPTSILVGKILS